MKKLTKILLGAGAFLVMSGGLLALTGRLSGADTGAMSLYYGGGRSSISPSDAPAEYTSIPSGWLERDHLEPFTKLDIDIALGDVTVQSGDDFGLWLSWDGGGYDLNYTQEEDGTLRVYSRSKVPSPLGVTASATIYVPQQTALAELEIHNSLGDVDLQGLSVEKLTVECSLGDLYLWDSVLGEGSLVNNMGVIYASGLTVTKRLDVDDDMGDVTLEGDLQGDIDVDANMGEVTLRLSQGEERYDYELETSMGEVYVNGENRHSSASRSGGSYSLDVEDDMGDIWIDFNC